MKLLEEENKLQHVITNLILESPEKHKHHFREPVFYEALQCLVFEEIDKQQTSRHTSILFRDSVLHKVAASVDPP